MDNSIATTWNFVLPSTCLYKGVSYFTYKILFAIQVIQGSLVLILECAWDSFFFSITVHLYNQLELLRIQFTGDRQKTLSALPTLLVLSKTECIKFQINCTFDKRNVIETKNIAEFQFILALKTYNVVMIIKTGSVLSALLL